MPGKLHVERLSYYRDTSLQEFNRLAEELFSTGDGSLERVRTLAISVSDFIKSVDPFIQQHTGAVCPDCRNVCCINRHSYHEHEDIIYLYALGKKLPSYEKDRKDSEPCQFLGNQGCTVSRFLRPYRCNWYFCTPLLESMQTASAPEYRRFTDSLERITAKREEMLNEFIDILSRVKIS